jgi:hypothetical protein
MAMIPLATIPLAMNPSAMIALAMHPFGEHQRPEKAAAHFSTQRIQRNNGF